ncbi:hypothetical protein GW933_02120 [Candidatus Falkowbacteria bacterium]|uniref:Uncharacterized protein n=1 Tax=Candidatus Buchananbacteria bacterium CG10_big_fil_rev_8_21_14_0_10_33_19 TaxID=1974525 RepID=A0A2H0W3U4_9BACT|nr:hypothetical protein [Candidatus Falkowbacteria bacterium]PIS06043.1 MAG: hypothetical protein COT80_04740 [Candidatus Buchananbacteria bacterium CG10_big_fil_rev_8_21_14_0_10_33_19]
MFKPKNVFRIEICHCDDSGQDNKNKDTKTPCHAICPFCNEKIRINFLVKHLTVCEKRRPAKHKL